MTNTDIINTLVLKWAGKTPQEIAIDVEMIFYGVRTTIAQSDKIPIALELEQVGILVNHEENVLTTTKGACRRKRNPNN